MGVVNVGPTLVWSNSLIACLPIFSNRPDFLSNGLIMYDIYSHIYCTWSIQWCRVIWYVSFDMTKVNATWVKSGGQLISASYWWQYKIISPWSGCWGIVVCRLNPCVQCSVARKLIFAEDLSGHLPFVLVLYALIGRGIVLLVKSFISAILSFKQNKSFCCAYYVCLDMLSIVFVVIC